MSWFGNTLLPVIEDTWHDREPPTSIDEAAKEVREAGHPDVADYLAKLNSEDFENLVWQITRNQQEWNGLQ